ncbi:TPA: Dam family site-specific DNA-(adenine-N6)-methyltransferase [Klebsiella aerogenes]|nr:Dam family site-specific DNA-(adenine-N6)-methyltransferase [Klebsiella aerogenes]
MIKSPLKWAGGKARVMPQLLEHLPKADCLIEPFVGSGTVFMNTEYRRYVLCDSNRALINFFEMLTQHTEELIKSARMFFQDGNFSEDYYACRDGFNFISKNCLIGAGTARKVQWAAMFLYLNRHGYNGLYRVNLKGEFNTPFGKFAAPYFPEKEMRLFAEKAKDTKAVFIEGDFRHTIPHSMQLEYDAVIYCDPPYVPTSKTANFTAYGKPFTLDDHRELVTTLLEAYQHDGVRSVVSNSDTPETRQIYYPFKLHTLNVRRSISTGPRKMASEIIGVLRVCDTCGNPGGGCPDCGPVMGNSTYNAMAETGAFDDLEAF